MAKKQRKFTPKFDVAPTATSAPIHWFALKKNTGVDLDLKQVQFAVGSTFQELGFEIPENATEKFCAVISLKDESRQTTLNDDWTWVKALITQTVAKDLYQLCIDKYVNHELEYDAETSKSKEHEIESFLGDFSIRIEHSVDQENRGRTRYILGTQE